MKKITGIYVPTAVPYHHDGSINATELRRHLQWLAENGVSGIFANGSTGEFTRLTREERRQIIEITTTAAGGKLAVIAGAVEATQEETLEACRYYAELGCQAAALCPPPYFKLGQESLKEHYHRLADRSALPVFLYNIPAFSPPLTGETIAELAQHPRIVGIKDSSRDFAGFLTLMREIKPRRPDFVFMTGTEEILLPAIIMGADGGTVATAGILPEVVMKLYHDAINGRLNQAKTLQEALLPLIKTMFSMEFPSGFRAALELRGFQPGPERQPLSERQLRERSALIEKLQPQIDEVLKLMGANQ